MPGDGWCFFYAVSRYFKGSTHSGHGTAAEIYLQAIEWLLAAQHGPRAEAVATACVPFDDDELQLREHFLRQQPTAINTAPSNTTEVVLLSKLHAVLLQLDSIHHASAGVELWALTQQFDFECLIRGAQANYWVRSMECLTDQEAHAKLQHHSPVLELAHRDMGVTGHYDLVERSQNIGDPFPSTPFVEAFRAQGARAVLEVVQQLLEAAQPPLPAPQAPPPEDRSTPQPHTRSSASPVARASLMSATGPPCNDSQISGDTPQLGCSELEDDTCWDGVQEEIRAAPESEAEAAAKQSSTSPAARASLKAATSPPCHDSQPPKRSSALPVARASLVSATSPLCHDSHVCEDTPQPACLAPEDNFCWDGIHEEVIDSEAEAVDVDVESVESWDSEGSMSSNDLDQGLTVEPHRHWCTKED